MEADAEQPPQRGSASEVLWAFTWLGLTSFGGPTAHIGYFRNAFVLRRAWLSEAAFADLLALCQFLPGPASSQLGFAIGLRRAGPLGAMAAWIGFTLPSALIMLAFAYAGSALAGPFGAGALHGLKLAAVAIVAQAVIGMARTLAPDRLRAAIGVGALALAALLPAAPGQLLALTVGALAGLLWARNEAPGGAFRQHAADERGLVTDGAGYAALGLAGVLALVGPLGGGLFPALKLFGAFYRSGLLVFGGGHVVLPLLQGAVVDPGWVSPGAFLAGYGAVQAAPGPLFTFAAYLGAIAKVGPGGVLGAGVALAAIFLPGLLLLVGVLPFWARLRRWSAARGAMSGAAAAVVGVLGAALYDPIWTKTVVRPLDMVLAVAGLVALMAGRASPVLIVAAGAAAGVGEALFR